MIGTVQKGVIKKSNFIYFAVVIKYGSRERNGEERKESRKKRWKDRKGGKYEERHEQTTRERIYFC